MVCDALTTANNAVVSAKLPGLVAALPPAEQALFRSHSPRSFDFRTDKIAQFFGTLRYLKSNNKTRHCPDAWLYPDETLAQGGGDCEDLAFLLAALLINWALVRPWSGWKIILEPLLSWRGVLHRDRLYRCRLRARNTWRLSAAIW